MSDKIVLKVNGFAYTGWKTINISQSMNSFCGMFRFQTSEKYPFQPKDWEISLGDTCSILVNNKVLSVGYIEDANISYDGSGHTIEFIGRETTCDLVDCTYNGTKKEWVNQTLNFVIKAICDHFSIPLKIDYSVTSIANQQIPGGKVTYNEGESAADFISKICKTKSLLPLSYGDGKLTITKSGGRESIFNDPISLSYNINAGSCQLSNRERFYKYIIKGSNTGDDNKSILEIAANKNSNKSLPIALDDAIKRTARTLTIIPDGNVDVDACNRRAIWEKNTRAGNSRKYKYKLIEWTQSDGVLWQLNSKVSVVDKLFGLKQSQMLISGLDFNFSENDGSTVDITLVDPKTYDVLLTNIKTQFDSVVGED